MFRIFWLLCLLTWVVSGAPSQKSVDESIEDSLETAHVPVTPVIELPNGEFLHALDEDVTAEEYKELFDWDDTQPKSKRLTVRAAAIKINRWPDAVVPYAFHKFGDPAIVLSAMKELEKGTCLKFKRKTSKDINYVSIINGSGCYSSLGRKGLGKEQNLSLSARGCRNRDTTLHELLHAVGVIHEQERPDRDKNVVMQWHNMKPLGISGIEYDQRPNFAKAKKNKINYYGVPYDFSSVMHYSLFASSKNRKYLYTMVPVNNDNAYKYVETDQKYGLSFGDYKLVNRMYKCGEKCKKKCPEPGFLTKNCKCMTKTLFYKQNCKGDEKTGWCLKFKIEGDVDDHLPPDKNVNGDEDEEEEEETTETPCRDAYPSCRKWAKDGGCKKGDSLYSFVSTRCLMSCKLCT